MCGPYMSMGMSHFCCPRTKQNTESSVPSQPNNRWGCPASKILDGSITSHVDSQPNATLHNLALGSLDRSKQKQAVQPDLAQGSHKKPNGPH